MIYSKAELNIGYYFDVYAVWRSKLPQNYTAKVSGDPMILVDKRECIQIQSLLLPELWTATNPSGKIIIMHNHYYYMLFTEPE